MTASASPEPTSPRWYRINPSPAHPTPRVAPDDPRRAQLVREDVPGTLESWRSHGAFGYVQQANGVRFIFGAAQLRVPHPKVGDHVVFDLFRAGGIVVAQNVRPAGPV